YLDADQHAGDEDGAVEQKPEIADMLEGEKEQRRRGAADCPDQDLDADEGADEVAGDVARQPGADAHGREVAAYDGGELRDAVAEQIAGKRAGDQLVDEAAGRDDEGREEQQRFHGRASATGQPAGTGLSHEWRWR